MRAVTGLPSVRRPHAAVKSCQVRRLSSMSPGPGHGLGHLAARYDHAFCSRSLRDLITDCGYLDEPREQKLSDHSALTLRFNLAPPQTLPVSDPAAVTEPATLF